ncbi:pollen-specific leucine-rich repeat extensin-like protein 1 [Telopea speciosissima]|uniref:pollen-specific leucine-rich repeat extensin-like protein 1 n=1 Tax=Telopea speciosissima TaxID=54955 RepID=UPI001CC5F610|nr:pollen-specific leucine-rich repeat extensin-like protein 1 [Telopea speciosissima]
MPKKTRGIRGIEIEEVKQENSDGETSERDDVQEELKPDTEEEPKPITREEDDRIGQTSTKSPKISHEEESSQLTSPELKEQDRDPEIVPPQTPDLDQPGAQEIEDHKLGGAEEVHEQVPEVPEEEVESKEADEEESPKAEPKKSVYDQSTQTEKWCPRASCRERERERKNHLEAPVYLQVSSTSPLDQK